MRTILIAMGLGLGLALDLSGAASAVEAPPGGAWTDCSVTSVAAFRENLLVTCAPPAGGGLQGSGAPAPVREFGIESLSPLTDPVLRLAMAAKSSGRPLGILYVKDSAANPPGCMLDRCRRIAGVELK